MQLGFSVLCYQRGINGCFYVILYELPNLVTFHCHIVLNCKLEIGFFLPFRYLFVLQLKQDILSGKYVISCILPVHFVSPGHRKNI